MKNILIPTDFSSSASMLLDYALNLYKCERPISYFLHAYADEVYAPYKTEWANPLLNIKGILK